MRRSVTVAAGAAVIALGVVGSVCTCVAPGPQSAGPGGGSNPTANIWIGAAGTCEDSATLVEYNAATSCGTFDAANDTADNGDLIRVKTGSSYGTQTVTGSNGRTAAATIQPDNDGSRITFTGDFALGTSGGDGPDYLTIKDVQLGTDTTSFANEVNLTIWDDSDNIVIDNWEGPSFDCFNCTNTTIKNSDWGPCGSASTRACLSRVAQSASGKCCVTIQDTVFHDIWCGMGSGSQCDLYHTDGLAVFGSDQLTLRRVVFYKNDITNIRFQNNTSSGRANTNVVVENSWFNKPCAVTATTNCNGSFNANAIDIDNEAANFILRFNSFADQTYFQCLAAGGACGTTSQPMTSLGNIYSIQAGFCAQTKINMSYNATNDWGGYTGGACAGSTGDVNGTFPTYANTSTGAAMDFHLSGASGPADNLVASGCIATDYDQAARAGSNCDAGSDER